MEYKEGDGTAEVEKCLATSAFTPPLRECVSDLATETMTMTGEDRSAGFPSVSTEEVEATPESTLPCVMTEEDDEASKLGSCPEPLEVGLEAVLGSDASQSATGDPAGPLHPETVESARLDACGAIELGPEMIEQEPSSEQVEQSMLNSHEGGATSSSDPKASQLESAVEPTPAGDADAEAQQKVTPALKVPNGTPEEQRRVWGCRHNKYTEQTDADPEWYRHNRHVLIFTYSGKPVFTRYGSEEGVCQTTGALSAIVSKVAGFFFDQGKPDSLRYMTAGEHIFVFLERGPIWLVCVSKCGDTYQDLVRMLDRVHMQIFTILTGQIAKTLKTNPGYDVRNLLGGTDSVVNNMVRWCSQDMYLQLEGFEPLPLAPAFRCAAVDALRDVRISNILCGFLMASHRILAMVTNKQYRVHALDLSMIVNIVMSSASLRTGEHWTPVCLVHLSEAAFAYAYVSFVDGSDVGIVFLSTVSDGEQFYSISQQCTNVKKTLKASGCWGAVVEAASQSWVPIDLRSSGPDEVPRADRAARRSLLAPVPSTQWRLLDKVIHAAYYVPSLQQFFSSSIAAPYHTRRRRKMLFRSYGRCRLLLRTAKMPSQICIATDHECFYVSLAAEYHLYLAVPRGISTGVIGQFYQWVKSQEAHIFLGHIPTW